MILGWRSRLPRIMTQREDDTTFDQLVQVLRNSYTARRHPLQYHSGEYVDCDEVLPNVFIGDGMTAKEKNHLKKLGITHVLNAAEGKSFGMVDTGKHFYGDTKFKYLGINMMDVPSTNISEYFDEASDFIHNGVEGGGKVYVHCLMGVSRSSTLVIAYMMIKRQFTAAEAIRKVREGRMIAPNEGFLEQLAKLDNKLRRERSRAADTYHKPCHAI